MEVIFVVKTKERFFNAVTPDVKMEQIIQRFQKNTGVLWTLIGHSRKGSYFSEWELVYHEFLSISNCYKHLTSDEFSFLETDLHHKLGRKCKLRTNICEIYPSSSSSSSSSFGRGRDMIHQRPPGYLVLHCIGKLFQTYSRIVNYCSSVR
jgi:hypothetical protein